MNSELTFKQGLKDTMPTVFGYIGIGIAFGMIGHSEGFSVWVILLLSLIVYAGSAQFIMVSMLATHSPIMSIVLSVFLKPGIGSIIIVIGCFSWMRLARLVRAETLSAKEYDYVVYSRFSGVKTISILKKHIIPAIIPTLVVAASASIANAIMTEAALSFLGLGIQQPMTSWGTLLQNAQQSLQRAPHMAIIPGLFVMLTIYSFNNIGNLLTKYIQKEGE